MLEAALNKLSNLAEQLVEKNTLIQEENDTLKSKFSELEGSVDRLKEENEALQLEALEQEEHQSATLSKINELLTRLQ
ncbi:DUF904 domain-containing protein [Colwelliaceae bacterium BS250]